MNKLIASLAVAAALVAAPALAVTATALGSFNGTNGNGGFTYGFTDGTALTAFDTSTTGAACALAGATCLTSAAQGALPFASIGGSFPTVDVPADAVVVHPGNSASLSSYVSFTAGTATRYGYNIAVQSRGIDTINGIGYRFFTSVGGVVTLGARTVIPTYLGTGSLVGESDVGAGNQFGFVIDNNGGFAGDSTGVNFSVTAVPEPASWGMLITGFALVGAAARRRRTAIAA